VERCFSIRDQVILAIILAYTGRPIWSRLVAYIGKYYIPCNTWAYISIPVPFIARQRDLILFHTDPPFKTKLENCLPETRPITRNLLPKGYKKRGFFEHISSTLFMDRLEWWNCTIQLPTLPLNISYNTTHVIFTSGNMILSDF